MSEYSRGITENPAFCATTLSRKLRRQLLIGAAGYVIGALTFCPLGLGRGRVGACLMPPARGPSSKQSPRVRSVRSGLTFHPLQTGPAQGPLAPESRPRVAGRQTPGFFKLYRDLPPRQQERALENDPRFQRLAPARQQLVRQRLYRWNLMRPEQKARFKEREEVFESLSPAQREEARALYPQWAKLPPGRRRALLQSFRIMRSLPQGRREQYLDNPGVKASFTPHEREILRGLARLLPDSVSTER
jgi:hypothetical protein